MPFSFLCFRPLDVSVGPLLGFRGDAGCLDSTWRRLRTPWSEAKDSPHLSTRSSLSSSAYYTSARPSLRSSSLVHCRLQTREDKLDEDWTHLVPPFVSCFDSVPLEALLAVEQDGGRSEWGCLSKSGVTSLTPSLNRQREKEETRLSGSSFCSFVGLIFGSTLDPASTSPAFMHRHKR